MLRHKHFTQDVDKVRRRGTGIRDLEVRKQDVNCVLLYQFLLASVTLGFPGGSAGKESAFNVGDLGSTPGLGRSSGEGNSYPFQYSVLENSMKRYDQPKQHTKKQRYYFTNKSPSNQSMVFLVVMYGCESWSIKKAEH